MIIPLLQIGVAISYAVWAVSYNFSLFVLARVIGGISKGNISLSTAIVADVSTPEKRGKGMVCNDLKIFFSLFVASHCPVCTFMRSDVWTNDAWSV